MLKKLFHTSWLLYLLVVFHGVGNLIWVFLNNKPPAWDEAAHTRGAFEFSHFFVQLLQGRFDLNLFLKPFIDPYAPLAKILAGIVVTIFYPDIKIVQFVGTIFFLGQLVVLYLFVSEVYQNKWIGFFAAFIYSFNLTIYDKSRIFSLDITTTFFVILAAWMYYRSEHFNKRSYTIVFFVFGALSVLTKIQSFVYLLPFVIYGLYTQYRNGFSIRTLTTLLVAALIGMIIVIPWLGLSIPSLSLYWSLASQSQYGVPIGILNLDVWTYYLFAFINAYSTPIIFFITIFCVYLALTKRHHTDIFFFFIIVSTYILLTVFPNKNIRFLMPIVAFVAILVARGLHEMIQRWQTAGFAILSVMILYNMVLYGALSFTQTGSIIGQNSYVSSVDNRLYSAEAMVSDAYSIGKTEGINIVMIPNFEQVNINTFNMFARKEYFMNITAVQPGPEIFQEGIISLDKYLNQYTYFYYVPSNDVGVPWLIESQGNNLHLVANEYVGNRVKNGQMETIAQYNFPDGPDIFLVKRK